MVERFEFPQIEKVYDKLSRVTKPDYPDTTRAIERAESELRHGEIYKGGGGVAVITTNCGQECFDRITITDVAAGVSNLMRRVLSIKTIWRKKTLEYRQWLTLGKV